MASESLSPFGKLCKELGLFDMWRRLHSDECAYTCYSKTYNSLSRIDLVLFSTELIPCLVEVSIEPRGISDRSPYFIFMVPGIKFALAAESFLA